MTCCSVKCFSGLEWRKLFCGWCCQDQFWRNLIFDRLTVEPRDFLSIIFKETRADMIYKIPILGSEESLRIYVLWEHKSYNDFFAVFQADQYAGQISQKEYNQAVEEKRLNIVSKRCC